MAAFPSLPGFVTAQDHETGTTVTILNPSGDESGITITVAGPHSSRAREFVRDQLDRRLTSTGGNAKRIKLDAGELIDAAVEELAHCTLAWTSPPEVPFPECNPDNAKALYITYPDIRQQVEQARADHANFTRKASKN